LFLSLIINRFILTGCSKGLKHTIIRAEVTIIAVIVVKGGDIETKIVYLVKGYPIHAKLQYDGTWGTDPSVAKINYYGNQSAI
jgi:hypothetical protein